MWELYDAYDTGRFDALDSISCVYYGKQCYFANENGTIYSRITCTTLPDVDSAIAEFCKYIDQ